MGNAPRGLPARPVVVALPAFILWKWAIRKAGVHPLFFFTHPVLVAPRFEASVHRTVFQALPVGENIHSCPIFLLRLLRNRTDKPDTDAALSAASAYPSLCQLRT